MRRLFASWAFFIVFLLIDFYVFQAIRFISEGWNPRARWWAFICYWTITALSIAFILALIFTSTDQWHRLFRTYLFAFIIGIFLSKILASLFFVADDLRRVLQWSSVKLFRFVKPGDISANDAGIPRSVFISWMGLVTGGGLFSALVYGFGNKYRYQVRKLKLHFPDLPEAFRGFRIVHISDIHSGSFTDKVAVQRGIERIQQQQADLILFTGDLVNQEVNEMQPYVNMFQTLNAPHGVFATLGNHDYGFPKGQTKEEVEQIQLLNAQKVKEMHQVLGWQTLSNEYRIIELNGASIALLGVDNISAKANFPSYGNLSKAVKDMPDTSFKILMSHDPSHWNKEITSRYHDIKLTLSGHTHGMQFGVELPGFRWSPVKYLYKQWAGHYREGDQHLYVNRGFGFIGYPGRVGILPEITVIELT